MTDASLGLRVIEFLTAEQRAEDEEAAAGGAALLDEVRAFVARFCVFPDEHGLIAVVLWAAHAHMVRNFHTTPRLAILSPEVASGKTRLLEVLDLVVPQSFMTVNASPAAIFRTLADRQITILFDEVDTLWNRRGADDGREDLRALLNAGYKAGATIPRCVGPRHEVQDFPVFCAVALAGLGDLPETLMSRAIILRMRRRAPHEHMEPFRSRTQEPEGHVLRQRLAEWAVAVGERAGAAWPELPPGIIDRPAEVWEPLLAIADVAGGEWPALARSACITLCKVAQDRRTSLGVRLLSDLQMIFKRAGDPEALHSATLIDRLIAGEDYGLDADAPWSDLHGKPLGKRGLASMLARYGVKPIKVKVGGVALQGYRREHLHDAWVRYLPPLCPAGPEPPEPVAPSPANTDALRVPDKVPEVPDEPSGFRNGLARDFPVEPQSGRSTPPIRPKVPEVPEVPEFRVRERDIDGDEVCV